MVRCLKSKQDKLLFLNKAIERRDGDFVTTAVLHMKDTLSQRIFYQEINSRQEATDSYINFLRVTDQTDKLIDFLSMTGRQEEAAIIKLKQALSVKSPDSRKKAIIHCNMNYFSSAVGSSRDLLSFWSDFLTQETALLERQLPIEEQDKQSGSQATSEENAIFLETPRSVVNLSVISTLFYCCLHHYDLPENYLASPVSIKKSFDLNDKQFTWTALLALSMKKRWNLVDSLFQGKSWLGTKKIKTDINFESVCRVLIQYEAPRDLLNKYALLIEDLEKRMSFAKEFNLTDVIRSRPLKKI